VVGLVRRLRNDVTNSQLYMARVHPARALAVISNTVINKKNPQSMRSSAASSSPSERETKRTMNWWCKIADKLSLIVALYYLADGERARDAGDSDPCKHGRPL
jgi:hypothetical protein